MPKIAAGSNATVSVPAGSVVSVSSGGGLLRFEFPSGTVLFEGDGVDQTFGPFSSSGNALITSLMGGIDYAVTTPPAAVAPFTPSNAAITGGKPAMIVAGVIRNFNDGQGWRLITSSDAANHSNLNIASVTSDTTQIYVNFGGSLATNVLSVVATPDETLAQAGFIMGSSVTTSQAIIKLAKYSEIADFVSYSGSAWQSMQGVFGSFSYSAGVLTMTNTAVQTNDKGIVGQATPRGDTYDVGLESLSATQTQLKFFARSGGALATVADANMKAYVSRGTKLYPMDPSTVHEGTYPGGNIWVFGVMQI